MVARTYALSGLLLLAGCGIFEPAEPEQPSNAGTAQPAKRPESVPVLFAGGLSSGSVLQTVSLVDAGFSGTSGGARFARSAFTSCLERLAKADVDTARFAWRNPPPSSTDSVTGDVDWTLVMGDGKAYGGRATWTVGRDEAAEWRLVRWIEPASAGNWSDVCGGF